MQTPAKDIYIGFNLKVLPGPRRVRGGPSWRSAIQFSESGSHRFGSPSFGSLSEGSDRLYILSLLSNSFFPTRLASRFFRGAPSRREAQPTLLPFGVNDFFSGRRKVW